jgi:hypothetical protein
MLLAEMFEEDLKSCSTSGTVEMPEHINILMLYKFYVKKKLDIYQRKSFLTEHT